MHYALNDRFTPEYVFSHVLKHELLHTRIRPREENGVWTAHPPEFWEEQKRIGNGDPDRSWQWIDQHFYGAIENDREHECILVKPRRMKEILHNRHCVEQDVRHLSRALKLRPNELRFGFREEALRNHALQQAAARLDATKDPGIEAGR